MYSETHNGVGEQQQLQLLTDHEQGKLVSPNYTAATMNAQAGHESVMPLHLIANQSTMDVASGAPETAAFTIGTPFLLGPVSGPALEGLHSSSLSQSSSPSLGPAYFVTVCDMLDHQSSSSGASSFPPSSVVQNGTATYFYE